MAKELPYFKFEPAEYLTKDISFCSLSAQGLFINICSYYWQRNCKLTKEQLLKRLNYEKELNELISEGVLDLKDNKIIIKFLDIQLLEVSKTSKQNSINGSKGGRPKKPKTNPKETENKPTALIPLSETKGIREEEIKEDEINNNFIKSEDDIFNNEYLPKYKRYCSEIMKDTASLESINRLHKISMDKVVCNLTITKYLKLFLEQINLSKEKHENKGKFNSHFSNWLRKQQIVLSVPKKEKIRYV